MSSEKASEILAAARDLPPWMIEIRRDLHRHPELGLEEHWTSSKVSALLDEMSIEHEDGLGGTSVVGVIHGNGDGKVAALRADLDALGVASQVLSALMELTPC